MERSLRWDILLPYVRREVYRRFVLPSRWGTNSMKQLPAGMTRLGLGGYPLGGGYGRVDEAQAKATVDAALDAGITYIDTAESYSSPRSGSAGS